MTDCNTKHNGGVFVCFLNLLFAKPSPLTFSEEGTQKPQRCSVNNGICYEADLIRKCSEPHLLVNNTHTSHLCGLRCSIYKRWNSKITFNERKWRVIICYLYCIAKPKYVKDMPSVKSVSCQCHSAFCKDNHSRAYSLHSDAKVFVFHKKR